MDISRLPAAPLVRPANASVKTTPQATSAEVIKPVASARTSRGGEENRTRVVQGELLVRERPSAQSQSTRSFVDERSFESARSGERQHGGGHQSQAAIALYLNNTRPEAADDLIQGRSVNFFV